MQDLADRVNRVLTDLSMLIETPAPLAFDLRVGGKGGKAEDKPPPSVGRTELEGMLGLHARCKTPSDLQEWCDEAEGRVQHVRKGQADALGNLPKLSAAQEATWHWDDIKRHEGQDARTVAAELRLDPDVVKRVRLAKGVTAKYGVPPRR
jgi:hypothetical protein